MDNSRAQLAWVFARRWAALLGGLAQPFGSTSKVGLPHPSRAFCERVGLRMMLLVVRTPPFAKTGRKGGATSVSKRERLGQPPVGEDLSGVQPNHGVLALDVQVPTYSKGHLLEPGTYLFKLTLAASNCPSTHHVLEVSYSGHWHPDEHTMFSAFKMELKS